MFPILLVTALCIDAFTAGFSYGVGNTRIPLGSVLVLSVVCTAVLALSIGLGSAAQMILPKSVTSFLSFAILFVIGAVKSFESALKRSLVKARWINRPIHIRIFDITFVLTVYADNIRADADESKVLSAREALYLALALSVDGLTAGFGYALIAVNPVQIVLLSLLSNALAIELGTLLGKALSKAKLDLTWLGGVLLIALAFLKLI